MILSTGTRARAKGAVIYGKEDKYKLCKILLKASTDPSKICGTILITPSFSSHCSQPISTPFSCYGLVIELHAILCTRSGSGSKVDLLQSPLDSPLVYESIVCSVVVGDESMMRKGKLEGVKPCYKIGMDQLMHSFEMELPDNLAFPPSIITSKFHIQYFLKAFLRLENGYKLIECREFGFRGYANFREDLAKEIVRFREEEDSFELNLDIEKRTLEKGETIRFRLEICSFKSRDHEDSSLLALCSARLRKRIKHKDEVLDSFVLDEEEYRMFSKQKEFEIKGALTVPEGVEASFNMSDAKLEYLVECDVLFSGRTVLLSKEIRIITGKEIRIGKVGKGRSQSCSPSHSGTSSRRSSNTSRESVTHGYEELI